MIKRKQLCKKSASACGIEARAMCSEYICSRIKVTCPRCGSADVGQRAAELLCHPCQFHWPALTLSMATLQQSQGQWYRSRLKIGDDSRLIRHERWLGWEPRLDEWCEKQRAFLAILEFRRTGRIPDFPGMGENG